VLEPFEFSSRFKISLGVKLSKEIVMKIESKFKATKVIFNVKKELFFAIALLVAATFCHLFDIPLTLDEKAIFV